MKNWNLPKILNTPLGIVITVAASIFGVELLFMALLKVFFKPTFGLSGVTWNVIDAISLTLVVAPLLYLLVFRKIKEGEDYLRQINIAAQDAIVIVDGQCRVIDWNPAAQKMFLYSREEALGRQLHKMIVQPQFRDDVDHGFICFRANGEGPLIGKITEMMGVRKDGSEFHVELSISTVRAQGGWHAIGIIRDITERKKADECLRNSERRLKEAQRIAHIGDWDLDLTANVLTWSDEIYRLFELDPEKFRPSYEAFLEAVHPDDRERVDKAYTESVINRLPYDIEHRLLMKDGRVKHVHEKCETYYGVDGKPLRSFGTVHDITERKQAEEIAAKAKAKFHSLFDSISDAVLIVGMNGKFIHANTSACTRLGYSHEELVQLSPSDIDTPEAAAKVPERIKTILEQGKLVFETTQVSKGGVPIEVELNSRLIEYEGKPAILSVARDITERKRMEAVLHQAKEAAEQALAEQRQLIAMISHEYRSPLAVIDSATQLLGVKLPAENDTASIIARIRRGVSRLTNFLDNCLTEGRMDSDTLVLRSSAIDLHALAATITENIQLICDGHRFIAELDPDLPLLDGDQQLMGIMLLNLLGNAIKYSPAGSEIRLRVTYTGQACCFEVIDRGCGIPADELPFIFQKYMRGRAATSIPGAGLGLSLVSKIVSLHGGSIKVESREGKGTHVTVTIPLNLVADRAEQLQTS